MRRPRNPSVAARAAAYGLPGIEVDGNDVLAVYAAAGEAVDRARAGGGPTLIECKTYRTRAHSEGMRETGYHTAEEIAQWRARDPIKAFRETLLAGGHAGQAELDALEAELKAQIEQAVAFAESSPLPDPATVAEHVYGPATQLSPSARLSPSTKLRERAGSGSGGRPAGGGQHA